VKEGHLEEAIANSNKAHALPKPHAASHKVAAWAFEKNGRLDRALAELLTFLEEGPSGARADAARKELEMVQALPQ
jgi:thioredoxin-like negative regulator of GroEL